MWGASNTPGEEQGGQGTHTSPALLVPTVPAFSPSFTEMVGFFCRSPNRMKKRTRGIKISKARTHWKEQTK